MSLELTQLTPTGRDLEAILQKAAEHKGCGTEGGAGKSSCGSSSGPALI